MSSWQNGFVVLTDDFILIDDDLRKVDRELYNACSIANKWIEEIIKNAGNGDSFDVMMV